MITGKYNRDDFKTGGYIGIAQINSVAGDFCYNSKKIAENIKYAESLNLDMVVFPELALVGYPIWDMVKRHSFLSSKSSFISVIFSFTEISSYILRIFSFEY